jgi:serine protease
VDYAYLQGTSMASANASGVAGLLLGIPSGASAARLREVLTVTAEDRGAPGLDDHYGAGIIDAARAARMLAGLPPPATPELALASTRVRVGTDQSALDVHARNDGGGALVLAPPTVTTDDGVPWLGAAAEGSEVHLEVDRDALTPGSYVGHVDVPSNGGIAVLTVVADVAAAPPADLGPVTILLRDFTSQAVVATAVTTAATDYRYRFDRIAPGRYEVLATTDRDLDGAVCDVGESCGAYPDLEAPRPVTVAAGAAIAARDFGLALVVTSGP